MESAANGCLSGGSEIAYPVDVSKSGEQEATPIVFEQSYGVSPRLTCDSSLHGEKSYRPHWNADPEETSGNVVEQGHDTWNVSCCDSLGCFRLNFDVGFHDLETVAIRFSGVLA